MRIYLTTGKGEGATRSAAFDAALRQAGIANYNLIALSSVIPPKSIICRAPYPAPADEYGHRLYLVMSRQDEQQPGKTAWAGLGWAQDKDSGRGMFVESHGADRARLEEDLRATLTTVIVHRPVAYGEIESEIVGIECRDKPVCALAVAVYKSEGW